jgi:hypothetical protein
VTAGPSGDPADDPEGSTEAPDEPDAQAAKAPAVERRRAVEVLLGLWADVARDVALVGAGGARSAHDTVLLDELTAVATAIPPGAAATFLARAARSAELLASNVSPELILDSVALAWPRRAAVA